MWVMSATEKRVWGSAVMRAPHDRKILIKRDADRNVVYISIQWEGDSGSIIEAADELPGVNP